MKRDIFLDSYPYLLLFPFVVYNKVMKYIILLLLALFAFPTQVKASEIGLTLTPTQIEVQLLPGESASHQLTISNTSSSKITLDPQFYQFKPDPKGDGSIQLPTTKTLNVTQAQTATYFSLTYNGGEVENVELGPGEDLTVDLVISIPENAIEKDTYTTLLFTSTDNKDSTISTAIGTNILLTVGIPKYQLIIENLSTDRFNFRGPVTFDMTIKNSGPNLTTTRANVEIYNMFGARVETLNSGDFRVLAGARRHITASTPLIWSPSFKFGVYTVKATLQGEDSSTKETSFIVLPLFLLLGIVVCLSFFIGIYLRVKKKV